jgi:hypothetical protein
MPLAPQQRNPPARIDVRVRTLFVAPTSDEAHVRGRIDRALRSGEGWRLLESRARQVALTEEELALRLSRTPTA